MGIAGTESLVKALEFGYANARVKAMKQSLLSEKELNALAEAKSIGELYSLLEKTQYREDLVASALKERTIEDQIEFATTKNFSRTLKKIVKITPEKARQSIMEMFGKYDINNIKTILVNKHLGEAKEKIEPFIMEPISISKGKMNKIMDAKNVREAINNLAGTEYGTVL
ncbi:MAG TPA: V-type ATPase subunit, partial [archaeon]|nr:V-type ATPase subunit [archaeon]